MKRRASRFIGAEKPGAAADKLRLARVMRHDPTEGEARLWAELRERSLGGWRFRRQHVIAGYIVDFYCPALALAVEVDGSVHETQQAQDADRDEHLARLGVRVLRVGDDDVMERPLDVLRFIAARCEGLAELEGVFQHSGRRPRR